MPPRPKRILKASKEKEEETLPITSPVPSKSTSRTRVSAACEACKKRKTKCTGEPTPCHLCTVLGTECVIDLSLDMRRRAAMQQTIDDFKSYQELFNGLADCIKDGDPDTLRSLRETFLRAEITKSEMLDAVRLCAQSVRARWVGHPPEDDTHTDADNDIRDESELSFASTGAEDTDEWSIEPSLRTDTLTNHGSEASDRLNVLHRRLRNCSDAEGSQLLTVLLSVSSLAEVEESIPVDRTYHTETRRHGVVDSLYGSSEMQQERATSSWHPTIRSSRSASDTVSQVGRFNKESSASSQEIHTPYTSVVPAHGEPSTSPVAKLAGTPFGSGELFTGRPLGQQHVARSVPSPATSLTDSYPLPTARLTPALSDLLVAGDHRNPQTTIPIHLVMPLLVPDDTSMSRVYTDYLYGARQMLAGQASVAQILGADDDVAVDLFFRHRQETDVWDCASWACEFCRGFGEFDAYLRLACVFILTRLMQWLLVPTMENYAKVPDMIKPTPMQRLVPHIGAIDLIPIPCLRDALIENFRGWITPLAEAKWTVNWPHLQDDAVEYVHGASFRRLSQRFIDHVTEYNNWSVGSRILTVFPEAAGRIRLHD